MLNQRDVITALEAYVKDNDEQPWREVIQAIRSGDVIVEPGVTCLKLRVSKSPARTQLSKRLTDLRKESGLSLQEVADAMSVSMSAVVRNINGDVVGYWPTVSLLVATLGGDPEEYREDWKAARDPDVQS